MRVTVLLLFLACSSKYVCNWKELLNVKVKRPAKIKPFPYSLHDVYFRNRR